MKWILLLAFILAPFSARAAEADRYCKNVVSSTGAWTYGPCSDTWNMVSGTASIPNSTTSLVAAVTGFRLYITAYECDNTGATPVGVSFQDGSGGTTLWHTMVSVGSTVTANSNNSGTYPMFKTTSGNALYAQASASSTTVTCSAAGFYGN